MKILCKSIIFFILILANHSTSATNFLQDELGEFEKIPKETIFKISSYLYGEDFKNLLLTSKPLRILIVNEKNLFFPDNDENLIKYAYESDLQNLCSLITRHPKCLLEKRVKRILEKLPIDQEICGERDYNKLTINWIAYNKLYKAFKLWGCNSFDDMYEGAKLEIEDSFEQTLGNYNINSSGISKDIIVFRWEQIAYVNEDKRQKLINAYREGFRDIVLHNPSKLSYWETSIINKL